MRWASKYSFLFLVGGLLYYAIECLYVGHSHPSMYILGGICFVSIGLLNEFYNYGMSLISQMFISSLIITVFEFVGGLIINNWLKLDVWDYSYMPYNLMGQINVYSSVLWFFLSFPAILIDDYLRYHFFDGDKPNYKIF